LLSGHFGPDGTFNLVPLPPFGYNLKGFFFKISRIDKY